MAVINVNAEVLNSNQKESAAAGTSGPAEWLLALPRLAALAIRLLFDSRVPAATKAALAGGLLYIISPIDLVPDMIPVLGQLEDMALAVLLIDGMVNGLDRTLVARHWRGSAATLQRIGKLSGSLTKVFPGFLRRRAMRKTLGRSFQPATARKA